MSDSLAFDSAVAELRAWLRDRQDDGADCPVCGQHVQAYRRTITRSMVGVMTAMFFAQRRAARRAGGRPTEQFVHLSDIPQTNRDTTIAAYFGLIEQNPMERGYWRLTLNGVRFLAGSHTVPKYAVVLHGERIGFEGDPIDVHNVEPGFDLQALTRRDDGDDQ